MPSSVDSPADARLIDAVCRRDPQAWAEVYERLSDQVFGFLLNQSLTTQDAEDLTAKTFLEALKGSASFEGGFPQLRSWIFRIARNNLIDFRRKAGRAPTDSWEEVTETSEVQGGEDTESDALSRLELRRVRDAIEQLSPDQREVLLLRLTGELTAAETAEVLGKTPGAVKALVHRGLKALNRELESQAAPPKGGPR